MALDSEIQVSFLKWVKDKRNPENISFVDEIGELLNISRDSAYRRLRGETFLSFTEIGRIAHHYKVSVDAFLNLGNNAVVFSNDPFTEEFTFKEYLRSIQDILKRVNQCETKKLTWLAKDVPILHYFQFPKLTGFKSYFWQRTIMNTMDQHIGKYDPDSVDPEIREIASSIWREYSMIPSVEIWSEETINITLRQIGFYHECGFISKNLTIELIEEFLEVIHHIRQEATIGKKISLRGSSSLQGADLLIYNNEIAIGDNTISFLLNDERLVFITYNVLNILKTSDDAFCRESEKFINNLLQKSIPLSASSEKERNRFFHQMESKISTLLDNISHN